MMRGATLVQKICPNVGDVKSTSGSQNCGSLKALKNSERIQAPNFRAASSRSRHRTSNGCSWSFSLTAFLRNSPVLGDGPNIDLEDSEK